MKCGAFMLTFVCLSVDLEVHGLADNKESLDSFVKKLCFTMSLFLSRPVSSDLKY